MGGWEAFRRFDGWTKIEGLVIAGSQGGRGLPLGQIPCILVQSAFFLNMSELGAYLHRRQYLGVRLRSTLN